MQFHEFHRNTIEIVIEPRNLYEFYSRSNNSPNPGFLYYTNILLQIERNLKKKKKMKNRQKLRSSKRSSAARITESKKTSRVFAANYHRRPSYLAALFNHDAIIKLSLHAAILDTRSILYDEALTLWPESAQRPVGIVSVLAGEPAYYHKFPSDRSEAN